MVDWPGYTLPGGRRPLPLAGCLRDAAPDAWGRRVIDARLASDPDADLGEPTCLLESGSDRIGTLDFETSPTELVDRFDRGTDGGRHLRHRPTDDGDRTSQPRVALRAAGAFGLTAAEARPPTRRAQQAFCAGRQREPSRGGWAQHRAHAT